MKPRGGARNILEDYYRKRLMVKLDYTPLSVYVSVETGTSKYNSEHLVFNVCTSDRILVVEFLVVGRCPGEVGFFL